MSVTKKLEVHEVGKETMMGRSEKAGRVMKELMESSSIPLHQPCVVTYMFILIFPYLGKAWVELVVSTSELN